MPRPPKHVPPDTLGGQIRAARERLHLSLARVAADRRPFQPHRLAVVGAPADDLLAVVDSVGGAQDPAGVGREQVLRSVITPF